MNGEEIVRHAAPEIIELLHAGRLTFSLFGSADESSEFEVSYINKADPEPFDELWADEDSGYEDAELVSLDDEVVTVEDGTLYIHQTMSLEDLLSYLYATDDLTVHFFDGNGEEMTDMTLSSSLVARVALYAADQEVKSYIVDGYTDDSANDPTHSVNTGDVAPAVYMLPAILLAAALGMAVMSAKKRQNG